MVISSRCQKFFRLKSNRYLDLTSGGVWGGYKFHAIMFNLAWDTWTSPSRFYSVNPGKIYNRRRFIDHRFCVRIGSMTLIMNYCYRIYPDASQEQTMQHWLEISRKVYNYALREIKDWVNSRKCSLDYCSLEREYIIPADKPFPTYYNQQNALPKAKKEFPQLGEAPSQVLQTTIRRLHDSWNYFQQRGFGFPRFKKFGQMNSMLFPQFKTSPITGWQISLPKVGKIPINLHRPIPEGFVVK